MQMSSVTPEGAGPTMHMTAKGIAALELEEGVVLRAYLCPAGRWTIGPGLTAASGVVKPHAGMVITREMATTLLQQALRSKYEPAVAKAMPGAKPHEFDAGGSFHWNCGTIGKASWAKLWRAKAGRAKIRAALLLWNKGGGKVLPGLAARRDREAAMLLDGIYRPTPQLKVSSKFAAWGLPLTGAEIAAARNGFHTLGYDVGTSPDSVPLVTAMAFQRDHGLTADGIIGRATLSTLQRRLDARTKPAVAGVGAAVGAGALETGVPDALTNLPGADWIILAAAALYGAKQVYTYRDVIAAKIAQPLPRLATILRSF